MAARNPLWPPASAADTTKAEPESEAAGSRQDVNLLEEGGSNKPDVEATAGFSVVKELFYTQKTFRVHPEEDGTSLPARETNCPVPQLSEDYYFPPASACNVSVEGVSGDDVAHRELRKQEMMSLVYSGVVGEKTVKGITAALLGYSALLLLKYLAPLKTPTQFLFAWALQVSPLALLCPVYFSVSAGHYFLLGSLCSKSHRYARYLRVVILPLVIAWYTQLQFQIQSISMKAWLPFNTGYTSAFLFLALVVQSLITCDFRWCKRQAKGICVLTAGLLQVLLCCLCFLFTFFSVPSSPTQSLYFLLFRLYGATAQWLSQWTCSKVVYLEDFGLVATITVALWVNFFAATALPADTRGGIKFSDVLIYLVEALFSHTQTYIKLRVLLHKPLRKWAHKTLSRSVSPDMEEWTTFSLGALVYLEMMARVICSLVMVPLFWWLRLGYNAPYYPFQYLPREALVGKSIFLLLTAALHVAFFAFLRRYLFLRKGLIDPLLAGSAYVRLHMSLFLAVGVGISVPFMCLSWQSQVLPAVFNQVNPALLRFYEVYDPAKTTPEGGAIF